MEGKGSTEQGMVEQKDWGFRTRNQLKKWCAQPSGKMKLAIFAGCAGENSRTNRLEQPDSRSNAVNFLRTLSGFKAASAVLSGGRATRIFHSHLHTPEMKMELLSAK